MKHQIYCSSLAFFHTLMLNYLLCQLQWANLWLSNLRPYFYPLPNHGYVHRHVNLLSRIVWIRTFNLYHVWHNRDVISTSCVPNAWVKSPCSFYEDLRLKSSSNSKTASVWQWDLNRDIVASGIIYAFWLQVGVENIFERVVLGFPDIFSHGEHSCRNTNYLGYMWKNHTVNSRAMENSSVCIPRPSLYTCVLEVRKALSLVWCYMAN